MRSWFLEFLLQVFHCDIVVDGVQNDRFARRFRGPVNPFTIAQRVNGGHFLLFQPIHSLGNQLDAESASWQSPECFDRAFEASSIERTGDLANEEQVADVFFSLFGVRRLINDLSLGFWFGLHVGKFLHCLVLLLE